MNDDTLDGLLLALSREPGSAFLVSVIADRLEETGHPAAAWWRPKKVSGLVREGRFWHFDCQNMLLMIWHGDPGVADLCQRLDRVAAQDRAIDAT